MQKQSSADDTKKIEPEAPLQFGVSVSKRYFKKAVHRNRIKRLIRESYRVEKLPLQEALVQCNGWCLKLFVIYTGKEMPDYHLIYGKVTTFIQRLEKEVRKQS